MFEQQRQNNPDNHTDNSHNRLVLSNSRFESIRFIWIGKESFDSVVLVNFGEKIRRLVKISGSVRHR